MKKFYKVLLVSCFILFFACEKEEVNVLTKTESKKVLSDASSKAFQFIKSNESDLYSIYADVKVLYEIMPLYKIINANFLTALSFNVSNKLSSTTISKSQLSDNVKLFGTYSWNYNNQAFDYVVTPSDKLIIKFPSKDSLSNNLKAEFSDLSIGLNGKGYVIKGLSGKFYRNNVLKIEFQTKNGDILSDSYPVSSSFYAKIYGFQTLEAYYIGTLNEKTLCCDGYIKANNEEMIKLGIKMNGTFNNFNSLSTHLDSLRNVTDINIDCKILGIRLLGAIDMATWTKSSSSNLVEYNTLLNQIVKVEFTDNSGGQIGILCVEADDKLNTNWSIKYSIDGTKDKLSDIFSEVLNMQSPLLN